MFWNRAEMSQIIAQALHLEDSEVWGSCVSPFQDIEPDDWYKEAVTTLSWLEYEDDLTPYTRDGIFDAECTLTRAEFQKVVIESWGVEKVTSGAPFLDISDAPEDLEIYIHSAVHHGLADTSNDTFLPNKHLTLGEQATFLYRAIDMFGREMPSVSDFSDDPSSQCQ